MSNHLNNHFIHYLLERVGEDKSKLIFAHRTGKYEEIRYPDLWNRVKTYANVLSQMGVKEGDIVAIILPTCKEFITSFFAIQLLKAVPVALYPPTSLAGLSEWNEKTQLMLNSVNAKFCVTDKRINQVIHQNIQILVTDTLQSKTFDFIFDIETFTENQLCFLQFSSGTTGEAKAVMISQRNAILNAKLIRDALPPSNDLISVASWLPLYHDMGLVGCLLMSILNGTDIVLIRPDDFIMKPQLWLQAIHDYRITCTTAPNFAYGLVQKRVSKEVLEKLDLSCMEAALCGAEMVYKETMMKFSEHLKSARFNSSALLPVYGMAEATLAVTFTDKNQGQVFITVLADALEKGEIILSESGVEIYCVGNVLPTFTVKVVNENDEKLEENKVGRVLVSGPCVSSGYYNDEVKTSETIIEGWLDTGDQGFIRDGQLYICGRLKDTMIIRGRNYYPTILEEKIQSISGLRKGKVVVSSCLNPLSETEEVVILAEVCDQKTLKTESHRIKAAIALILSKEGLPLLEIGLMLPGTLKRTSSGKIQRRKNVSLWRNGELQSQPKLGALQRVKQFVEIINISIMLK